MGGEDMETNLPAFKEWLDREMDPDTSTTGLYESVSTLQYQYGADINTHVKTEDGSWRDTDVTAVLSTDGQNAAVPTMMSSRLGAMERWSEMLSGSDGQLISELVYEQYDLLAGEWPAAANEVVLILDSNNEVTDITLYALGLMSDKEVSEILFAVMNGEEIETGGNSGSPTRIFWAPLSSVLERTQEIGILRSVGASKKDISRVFNAETVIVGFTAGLLGIGVTLLLNLPISFVTQRLTGIGNIAVLPAGAALTLVAISVAFTMFAGLLPSRMAAKKDPVVALRTEKDLTQSDPANLAVTGPAFQMPGRGRKASPFLQD